MRKSLFSNKTKLSRINYRKNRFSFFIKADGENNKQESDEIYKHVSGSKRTYYVFSV